MSILKQKEVEIDGVTYVLQKMPLKSYLEANDRCMNKYGVLMKTQYSEELFKHCVVSPKVTLADFNDNIPAYTELVSAVETFQQSKSSQQTEDQEESRG